MVHSIPGPQNQLGQVLKELELVTERQIQEALAVQRTEGGMMGEFLVKMQYIAREELLLALAAQGGIEIIDVREIDPGDPLI